MLVLLLLLLLLLLLFWLFFLHSVLLGFLVLDSAGFAHHLSLCMLDLFFVFVFYSVVSFLPSFLYCLLLWDFVSGMRDLLLLLLCVLEEEEIKKSSCVGGCTGGEQGGGGGERRWHKQEEEQGERG